MKTALYIFMAVAVIVLIKYIGVRKKTAFYESLKPGDWVVGSGIGGYHIDEYVLEKYDDKIWLSESGWMSRGRFLFYGELEYFSRADWYFW